MYTDAFIKQLIECPKVIVDSPKSNPDRLGSKKRNFTMQSVDGLFSFSGFISENIKFSENFSIGLVYYPKQERESIVLLRCNGMHGSNKNIPHHNYCHVHTVLAEDVNNGITTERHVVGCTEYSTVADCLQYYIKKINLEKKDCRKYFPPPTGQFGLFVEENG